MRIHLLYIIIPVIVAGCNEQPKPAQPEGDRVIRDTVANELLRNFDNKPLTAQIQVQVSAQEQQIPRIQNEQVEKVWQQLKPTPQKFRVNNQSAVTLVGEQGTKISFDAGALVLPDGRCPNGDIDIELFECYNSEDYIRHNLGTIPGGALLNLQGALSITAFYNSTPLNLSNTEDMLVVFPKSINVAQSDPFIGVKNKSGISWLKADEWNHKSGKRHKRHATTAPEFNYNGLPLQEYLSEVIRYPEYAKTNELSGKANAVVKIDETGKVSDVEVSSNYVVFRDEIKNVLLHMPNWEPARFGHKNMASAVKISFQFNLRDAVQISVAYQPKDYQLLTTTAQNGNYQVFNDKDACLYGSLGWVSCGTIIPSYKNKADVVVQANSFTDIKVFLPQQNCLVSAENYIGYSRFKNIPANEQAIVFGIKANGETFMYSLQELSLKKQNVITPDWKKAEIKEVVDVLQKVNG